MITDNIFRRIFTAHELYHWLQDTFPDSFQLSIYKQKDRGADADYDNRVWSMYTVQQRTNYHPKKYYRGAPTEYRLYMNPEFAVRSGGENTYIDFVIDTKSELLVATWGYKRDDVARNYAKELTGLILDTCQEYQHKDYCGNRNYWDGTYPADAYKGTPDTVYVH